MIYEPMQRLAQTVHLSCTETNIVSKRSKTRFHMTHVNLEFHRVCLKWFLSLWYIRCKPCTYLASRLPPFQTEWNRHPLEHRHLGVPSGASKMIYESMVCFTQTMYLSCTDTNKYLQTDRNKIPHGPHHQSPIWCVQNDFWVYGAFGANRAPILRQGCHYLQTDWIELPLEPHHLGVSWVRSKQFLSLWYVWRKPCTYLALKLTLSSNGPKWDSTWPTSPRSFIGCIQNDFWACGTFDTICAPILHQD
jgi:hypothetical protein